MTTVPRTPPVPARPAVPVPIRPPAGFAAYTDLAPRRRLIINSWGMEKSGKTDFALRTAPGPVYHIITDPNAEEVHKKVRRETGRSDMLALRLDYDKELKQSEAVKQWAQFKASYLDALRQPRGTLAVDTGTEMYELSRLAAFGKLEAVQPFHYGPVNREIKDLILAAYDSNLSVVFLHKMRPEYVNDKKTGGYERAGWGDMEYEVQVNLFHEFQPPTPAHRDGLWLAQVRNSNMLPGLSGSVLDSSDPESYGLGALLDLTFPDVGTG